MRLSRYLSRLVIGRVFVAGIVLSLLGLSLDLLKSATKLLEEDGAVALLHYALLRLPQIFTTLFPIAVLTGGVLTFNALVRRSESVVISGAGRGSFAVLRMLLPCALLLGVGFNLLGDRVTPWADRMLADTFPRTTQQAEIGAEIWSRSGAEVLHARLGAADGSKLTDLTIWELDQGGLVIDEEAFSHAAFADGIWLRDGDALPWETRLTPSAVRALATGALAVSALDARAALTGAIVSTRGDAYYATRIARGYLAFFVPFLMLLIASIAIFGSNRSHGASINAVIAVAAGFLYVVFDGVAGTLSEVGAIDAIIAATVPTAAFGALGIWALIKLEEL